MSIIALVSVIFVIVTLIKADKKSAEIAELAAKVDLLQQETGTQLVEKEENGTTVTVVEPAASSDVFSIKDAEVRAIINNMKNILDPIAGMSGESDVDGDPGYGVGTIFDGLQVRTSLDKSYGIKYPQIGLDKAGMLYEKTVSNLESLGFVKNEQLSNPVGSDSFLDSKNNIFCDTSNSSPFIVACGYYKWVTDEKIALINQLAEAYKRKEGKLPYSISITKNNIIKDSNVSPYQNLWVNGGGAALLFYRTSPSAEWQFFTGAQGLLSCSKYNTQDLKNAFAGEACFNEANGAESTVQP